MKTTGITTTTTSEPLVEVPASGSSSLHPNFSHNSNSNFENSASSSNSTAAAASASILKEVPISIADIDAEDVIFYAKLLGIDPFLEPHLLWIAQAGLVAPLPVGWFAVEDHRNRLYYYNWATGDSSWEHPNDVHYRALVTRYRRKHQQRKENEGVKKGKKKKKGGSRGVSPSSATNSATMSGGSTLGNLHFFEDDDDDAVFRDLLKPRGGGGNSRVPTTTKPATTVPSKPAPPASPAKEDSIESVEFDLENSHHEEEEGEGSIASLEALQSGAEVKKSKEEKVTTTTTTTAGEDKRSAPEEDNKLGKEEEDSDPESDHWNSLPDNELDPFADLFQKSSAETSNHQHQQRPMSAKVRPISAVEQQQTQQQQQKTPEVVNSRGSGNPLRKHLSILEEDDAEEDDEVEEVVEEEDIEEVFEDDALEEVNELEEEDVKEGEDFEVISNKPAAGSSTAAAAASAAQMSQMGRIKGREINAQINGVHLLPADKNVNGAPPPMLLLLGKPTTVTANSAEKLTSLEDFEPEEMEKKELIRKKSSTEEEEDGNRSFQELGRRLEAEIVTLKEALRSEMTASQKTTTDLLTSFKADLTGDLSELRGKVDSDRADIRFLGERLDQLWTSLKTVERTVEAGSRTRREEDEREREKEKENQEAILERLLEKALSEKRRLDGGENDENEDGIRRKVLEEKLTAAQVESGRQLAMLRETLSEKIAEVRKASVESSQVAMDELRGQVERLVASGQRELRVQFQQQSREEGERLRAALGEEMERRLREELARQMKKVEEEKKESGGVQAESAIQLEQQLQQIEANRRAESEQLRGRLDGLQARIDAVEVAKEEMAKKSRRRAKEAVASKHQQPSGSSVVVQQCRELQRALHDCALQLNERIVELKLEDEDENKEEERKNSEVSSDGDSVLQEKKRSSAAAAAAVRHSRSQGNLLDNDDNDDSSGDSDGDNNHHQNRPNVFRLTESSPSRLQPANRSLSKSTPNLCQHCQQHQQQVNSSGVNHHHPHHYQAYPHHRHHYQLISTAPINTSHQFSSSSRRTERKLQSIRSSSRALIEQIRSTGSQLRAELASLQQSTGSLQPPKSIFSSSVPLDQLVLLNSSNRRSGGENQPRIFFDGGGASSDEQSLIRQLRSIRSTVNDRLAKMAVVIEGQKTTQI